MNPLTWQNPEQLFVAQVLKKIFYNSVAELRISKRKKDNYENQVAALEKAFTSTLLLMQHGNTTYLEVLTARQTLLNAQLSQTANCFKEIQSLINLYQALGGGQHI